MDSEARAFETVFAVTPDRAGTPLPCHHPMVPQKQSLFAALLAAAPARRQPVLIDRRRA
jgi:hypothetical protein